MKNEKLKQLSDLLFTDDYLVTGLWDIVTFLRGPDINCDNTNIVKAMTTARVRYIVSNYKPPDNHIASTGGMVCSQNAMRIYVKSKFGSLPTFKQRAKIVMEMGDHFMNHFMGVIYGLKEMGIPKKEMSDLISLNKWIDKLRTGVIK